MPYRYQQRNFIKNTNLKFKIETCSHDIIKFIETTKTNCKKLIEEKFRRYFEVNLKFSKLVFNSDRQSPYQICPAIFKVSKSQGDISSTNYIAKRIIQVCP